MKIWLQDLSPMDGKHIEEYLSGEKRHEKRLNHHLDDKRHM